MLKYSSWKVAFWEVLGCIPVMRLGDRGYCGGQGLGQTVGASRFQLLWFIRENKRGFFQVLLSLKVLGCKRVTTGLHTSFQRQVK